LIFNEYKFSFFLFLQNKLLDIIADLTTDIDFDLYFNPFVLLILSNLLKTF